MSNNFIMCTLATLKIISLRPLLFLKLFEVSLILLNKTDSSKNIFEYKMI